MEAQERILACVENSRGLGPDVFSRSGVINKGNGLRRRSLGRRQYSRAAAPGLHDEALPDKYFYGGADCRATGAVFARKEPLSGKVGVGRIEPSHDALPELLGDSLGNRDAPEIIHG